MDSFKKMVSQMILVLSMVSLVSMKMMYLNEDAKTEISVNLLIVSLILVGTMIIATILLFYLVIRMLVYGASFRVYALPSAVQDEAEETE